MEKVIIGDATLYHGDCMDVLPTLGKVDVVVTDPPYGIGFKSSYTAPTTTAQWMNKSIKGDSDTKARNAALSLASVPFACFCSVFAPMPKDTIQAVVWDKGPASGMGDLSFPWKRSFELICFGGRGWNGRRDEGVIKGHEIVTRASMGRVHPNEKPIPLLETVAKKSPPGVILDPFMGSGTTGVACMNLGREFIGIEIERKYFDIACERIEAAQSQGQLFVSDRPGDSYDQVGIDYGG